MAGLLELAEQLVRKGKKNDAAAKYKEVLELDRANDSALGFMETFLRQARKYADLRDVLLGASRVPGTSAETRKGWLREIAALCETQLRDLDTAIQALQQIVALDRADDAPRAQLKRLLERSGRWDDLATLLEQEAEQAPDVEARISLEKNLAKLHETKRKDPVAAGETWARIASLTPDDETAIVTAVKLLEKGSRADLAAQVIADNIEGVTDERAKGQLYKQLGEFREAGGNILAAGEAFMAGAQLGRDAALYEAAERCFGEAGAWDQAAAAIDERAGIATMPNIQAALYAKEAEYLSRSGDEASAVLRLEQATELDPANDGYASSLEERYTSGERPEDLATFLLKRAEKLKDKTQRMALRRRAATIQKEQLGAPDAARESLQRLLSDGDDAEALLQLADDSEERGEHAEAVEYLRRLGRGTTDPARKLEVALREARLVASGLDDAEGAVERYECVLADLDEKNEDALQAIAELHEKRSNHGGQAGALERHLLVSADRAAKLDIAQRLAALYEGPLDDAKGAIKALDVVRSLDNEDFDAVQRLRDLCEKIEDWPRVAELTSALIEVEGDEEEVSRMTRRLAEILESKVGKGDDALAALMEVADRGDEPCREAYVELGDKLGWKGIVATKLVEWYEESPAGVARNDALRGAFERFVEVGRDQDAAGVAKELARTKGADQDLARQLEDIATRLKDLDALGAAHDLLIRELSGPSRAEEMVRQAEVLVQAGVDPVEAIQHGEQALTSVPPDDVEPLLGRLAALAPAPGHAIDLYERQISRCKAPPDRLKALARAAQVAGEHDSLERARGFFDLALGGGVQEETLHALEGVAREQDTRQSGTRLRRTLADALAAGGQGSRDGGRTRGALLRRAAVLAHRDLGDVDQAFKWLGDALVTHVDDLGLDALEELAKEVGDPKRAETVLGRALDEVFDGPLVRKLLARRALIRREKLSDKTGAAGDLKRLHDLSPSDTEVMDQLLGLYAELEDWRGMVQLYEDQILRGKDPSARAELARKVARLWEEKLDDPREAADAWRRVLRMKSGDPEATEGLERSKQAMISRPPPKSEPPAAPKAAPPAKPGSAKPTTPEPPAVTATPSSVPTPVPSKPPALAFEDDDKPTTPPGTIPEAQAVLQAEQALAALKPARPDISFSNDSETTISAPLDELEEITGQVALEDVTEPKKPARPAADPEGDAEPLDVDEGELIVTEEELQEDK